MAVRILTHRAHLDVLTRELIISRRINCECRSLSSASRASVAIRIIVCEAGETRVRHTPASNGVTLKSSSSTHPTHRVEAFTHGRPTLVITDTRQHGIVLTCGLGPLVHPRLTCHLHRLLPVEASVSTAHAPGYPQFVGLARAAYLRALPIPAHASVCLTEVALGVSDPSCTLGRELLICLRGRKIGPVERGKALLGISHALLWRTIGIVGISDEVWSMSRALMRQDFIGCHNL